MSNEIEGDHDLQRRIAVVNRVLATHRSLPAKLEAVAAILQRTITGCESVSIGLLVQDQPGTAAFHGDLAIEADIVQYSTEEGPCLDAVRGGRTVRIEVLRQDETYQHFAPLAIELGVEAVNSVPLAFEGAVVGTANLYSGTAHAFDDVVLDGAQGIFDYAGEAIATSPLYAYSLSLFEGLVETVQEREAIAIAVGILMETNRCSEATAMTLLRRASDTEGRTMVDVATLITDAALLGFGAESTSAPALGPTDQS
ncbi:MAG: hypothetical protein JWM47_1864 [Acidimicrobiales bacterium]|nr:hypothetical protein [Acidimicrobiales bacterium]